MTSASPIAALVSAAAEGDQSAWNEIVDRYTPLVVSVIYKHRLRPADAADVNQTLWLRLVEQIGRLREPEALPGWIMTTTRNECLRVLRVQQRTHLYDPLSESDALESEQTDADVESDLLAVERRQALRDGFAELTDQCKRLLTKLMTDPPPSYQVVSEELAMPVGSIGPTRIRCLEKLRRTTALSAFLGSPLMKSQQRGGVLGAARLGQ
ncbi:sigma-70 family RNA polymerase sigma factor [Lentzea sp. BCCO 10_0856]|uniref:Sigma-70 family RNA polymerase sigma factor n=1 Tax=Lentzea miocenica TaxID=3095431 RepID=A0ABU4T818_9PSEU|nr:sigma-70 family RNA polymerase sigma factor [Lentzea sp. BCCO 10_0856]MDX8034303.1 sigma-70 family RNA polymerase sigma factor [Lentzea sp. BCCO 10_0856]